MSRTRASLDGAMESNASPTGRIPRSGLLKGAIGALAGVLGAGLFAGAGSQNADAAGTAASNFTAYGTDTTFTGNPQIGFDASDQNAGFIEGVYGTGTIAGVIGVVGNPGKGTQAAGVLGLAHSGHLPGGIPYKAGTGVFAVAAKGAIGVDAYGSGGIAVHGTTRSDSSPGILGQNNSRGPGIRGASQLGRGGVFEGGLAAVRLAPSTAPTHPRGGQVGDLMVDSAHRLWFCKRGGNPARWKQLA